MIILRIISWLPKFMVSTTGAILTEIDNKISYFFPNVKPFRFLYKFLTETHPKKVLLWASAIYCIAFIILAIIKYFFLK